MTFFRRSLAEDAVDRYNHTWGVMFLLLLSLTTWLLPLSPRILAQQPASMPTSSSSSAMPEKMPEYQASCWCPSEFSDSMIAYAQSVCSAEFNRAINGITNGSDGGAALYEVSLHSAPAPIESGNQTQRFQPVSPETEAKKIEKKKEQDQLAKNNSYFINFTVPFALFVLAICLKLPHLVWTLLSSFMGINVRGTLESLKSSHSLDTGSRQQLKQELVSAVTEAARATSFTTSLLYLTFKALMVAAALGSLLVVRNDLLPQAQNLNEVNQRNSVMVAAFDEVAANEMPTTSYTGQALLCDFTIRKLQNIAKFMVQCTFRPVASDVSSVSAGSSMGQGETIEQLGMYETVFTFLMVFYCILTVVNILSLVSWTFKLIVGPCRKRVTSNPKMPTDMYLLLFMAQENVGNLAAKDLSWGSAPTTKTDRESLQE